MPYCPECQYEYVEGITQCADCEVDLLDTLPNDDTSRASFSWAPLPSLPGPVYAEMIKDALERKKIPCLIRKDALSSAYGSQGTTSGGLASFVFVPEDRLEESKKILHQMLNHI